MDIDWALTELEAFLELTTFQQPPRDAIPTPHRNTQGRLDEIVASAEVVEQIFDRVIPDWRTSVSTERNRTVNRWCQHIEAAQRTKAKLVRQAEVNEKLGDAAPDLNAGRLHPWIWDGARSLWSSGHHREAVNAAAIKLNAETQNKLGRFDISETELFKQAFTLDPPKPGAPRLRVIADDGSKTYQSVHRGIMCFAEGCYAAIRNPAAHTEGSITEDQAHEQLAAFSVLARWVETATLHC